MKKIFNTKSNSQVFFSVKEIPRLFYGFKGFFTVKNFYEFYA